MRTVPALAIRAGEDPLLVRLRLSDAHQQFMLSHLVPSGVRPVLVASWRRCAVTGLSGAGNPPPVRLDTAGLADYRSRHPLAAVMPVFRDLLGISPATARTFSPSPTPPRSCCEWKGTSRPSGGQSG